MNEVIVERLKKSKGKEAEIFLKNDFRYFGKVTNCDDHYLELLDYRSKDYVIIAISNIKHIDIKNKLEGGEK